MSQILMWAALIMRLILNDDTLVLIGCLISCTNYLGDKIEKAARRGEEES